MQTRSSLQRRSNSESSDRVIASIKPRSWGDPPQHQTIQPTRHDFSHVDLFAHDPGPRSISHGVQAKLTIGAPNDVYEQEADAVAEQVMAMPAPQVQQTTVEGEGEAEEAEEALQPKLLGDVGTPLLQRQTEGANTGTVTRRQPFNLHPLDRPSSPVLPWWGMQAKLTIGQPNDAYEQEADQVAERVMSMAVPTTPSVQRQVEAEEPEEIQMKSLAETITPLVQRQEIEDEEPLQAKCEACKEEAPIQRAAAVPQVQPALENRLNASQGGGSPLPDGVRSFMEPRFGADFSQVRVHTGSEAVQMNRDLNAQAFAHKQDIYFGAGKAPANDALTAHELTHVVQQNGAERIAAQIQRQSAKSPISTPLGKGVKFAADGSAQLKAGSVEVAVLPDQVSDTLSNEESSAETTFNLEGGDAPGCEFNDKGKVTKIDPIPPIKVTIQTTYRTGASPGDRSAYGKGTTKKDVKARNTSLRYHEGSHGSDYINYLKTHPLPKFKGTKGMTTAQFSKAKADYLKAIETYRAAMDAYSEAHTDCVGTKGTSCP